MITGCRWHEYLHPTPRCPSGNLQGHRQRENEISSFIVAPRSLFLLASTYITTCPPDGGVFIVVKMEVFLLLRNSLKTQLSWEEGVFVLAKEENILYTDIGLQKHYHPIFNKYAKGVT